MMAVNSDKIKLTETEEKAYKADVLKNAQTPQLLKKQAAFMAQGGTSRNAYAKELEQAGARAASVVGAVKAGQVLDAPYTHVDEPRLALALVPKEISEGEAISGFTTMRAKISEDDLADMKASLIASRGVGMGTRMFQERLSDIRKNGVWIDTPGGFVLMDPVSNQAVAVRGGKPFKITKEQLKDAARNRPSMTGSVADDIPMFGGN
jgi:hypothetical protein